MKKITITRKKVGLLGNLLALALGSMVLPACDVLFDNVDTDPHPPVITNFTYGPTNMESGQIISGTFTYIDSGGDIELFDMRDMSGDGRVNPSPPPVIDEEGNETFNPFFFPGTTGTIEWQVQVDSNQIGVHTFRAWVVDSKGSMSDVVQFDVNILIPGST